MLRFLPLISLVLLLGCAVQPKVTDTRQHRFQPEGIFRPDSLYTFRAVIKAWDKTITGLLYVKMDSHKVARVVFSNEGGFQLMALEFENGEMISHKVFKKLDKSIVLNTLAKGIRTLFFETLCTGFTEPEEYECQCENRKQTVKVHYNENGQVDEVGTFRDDDRVVSATFMKFANDFPDRIVIAHDGLKLSYELNTISQ